MYTFIYIYMLIGVISDTHGTFDEPFRRFLEPVDEIWHAGDMGGGYRIAAEISQFKPLVGVIGNIDERGLMFDYPPYQFFEREGLKILMTHIGGYPGRYDPQAKKLIQHYQPDIFVCGHSHILKVMNDKKMNMICVNPGAAGLQGFHIVRTALRFRLENKQISDLEVFELDRN